MIRLITIVGARPQIIKSAAVSRAVRGTYRDRISEKILHTGQHYDAGLSAVFFSEMDIPAPEFQLSAGSGTQAAQTSRMLTDTGEILAREKPDAVLVYGDTNSTLAAALAASKLGIPVIHVEAGLRSFDKQMPEEINRIMTDHVSTLLFSPTLQGMANLRAEGFRTDAEGPFDINRPGVFHCGDIMLDNTLHFAEKARAASRLREQMGLEENGYALVTVHRDQNTDDPERLAGICGILLRAAQRRPLVFPVHPRTEAALKKHRDLPAVRELMAHPNLRLTAPASYLEMTGLLRTASLVLTDSGGVQKEAYFLKRPCIILRSRTEWTEIVETGHAVLAGSDPEHYEPAAAALERNASAPWPSIFGDGNAAAFICETICRHLT
jgi:UDP-GlcNAc3NAcA epimerase